MASQASRACRFYRSSLALAVVAIGCAACSLLVSLDDLGPHDVATDAAPDAFGDVVTPDAAGDVAASDAPFCKQADHSLCDDFDELPLGALWSSQHVTSATLALDDAAVSPPYSLLAGVPSPEGGSAYLQKYFAGTASHVLCQFDVRVDAMQDIPVVSFQLAMNTTDPSSTGYDVTLVLSSTNTSYSEWAGFSDGGQWSNNANLPALPVGGNKWTHVVVDMAFAAGSINITFDGASVLASSLTPQPNAGQTLFLGVTEYLGSVAAMHFDNVACDVTP